MFNSSLEWHYIILATILFVVASVIIDGLVAFIIRRLPYKWIRSQSKFFNVSKKEVRFYDKIGITLINKIYKLYLFN